MKVKRLILVDGDDYRKDVTRLLLGSGVELLTERHDVHTLLTQRGPNRAAQGSPHQREPAI